MILDDFFMYIWAVVGIIGIVLAIQLGDLINSVFPSTNPFLKKALVIILSIALFCIGCYETCMVDVPDVTYETYPVASQTLKDAGLHVEYDAEPYDGQLIVRQSKSNCRVFKGSTIKVYFYEEGLPDPPEMPYSPGSTSIETEPPATNSLNGFNALIASTDVDSLKGCTDLGAFILGNYDSGQAERFDLSTGVVSWENLSDIDGLCPIYLIISGIEPDGKSFYVTYADRFCSDPIWVNNENTSELMITKGRYALFARDSDASNDENVPIWVGTFDVSVPGECFVEMSLIS